ncbi:MAG: sigma-70 family RNA polymerase sigma factor [Pyrinomonadaceae bacterium]|nr:sigma-70 family RNA polymerase sigma factor [Pyrinomonadaceae bacterium]
MAKSDRQQRPITTLLHEWQEGKEDALNELLPYVYEELRRRASAYLRNERPGHTLQTSALVNEAYIKLLEKGEIKWENRNHFFAIAAQAMRRILVDHARKRNRQKRGSNKENLQLDEARYVSANDTEVDLEALDQALKRLAEFDERQARIVELKYFGGMTLDETAEVVGVSRVTVKRDWNLARAWLRNQLRDSTK